MNRLVRQGCQLFLNTLLISCIPFESIYATGAPASISLLKLRVEQTLKSAIDYTDSEIKKITTNLTLSDGRATTVDYDAVTDANTINVQTDGTTITVNGENKLAGNYTGGTGASVSDNAISVLTDGTTITVNGNNALAGNYTGGTGISVSDNTIAYDLTQAVKVGDLAYGGYVIFLESTDAEGKGLHGIVASLGVVGNVDNGYVDPGSSGMVGLFTAARSLYSGVPNTVSQVGLLGALNTVGSVFGNGTIQSDASPYPLLASKYLTSFTGSTSCTQGSADPNTTCYGGWGIASVDELFLANNVLCGTAYELPQNAQVWTSSAVEQGYGSITPPGQQYVLNTTFGGNCVIDTLSIADSNAAFTPLAITTTGPTALYVSYF